MKQCLIQYIEKNPKSPSVYNFFIGSRIAPAIGRFKWQGRGTLYASIMVSVTDSDWFQFEF
jgi:hypothetical protein